MFAVKMDDCLIRGDSSHLVSVIHYEGLTSTTLTRLDQLVSKDLCGSGFSRFLVVLKSLRILSENKDDLQTLIGNGLTAKVLLWFEAVCDLLTSDLNRTSNPLLNLTEEFYDYFLGLATKAFQKNSNHSPILVNESIPTRTFCVLDGSFSLWTKSVVLSPDPGSSDDNRMAEGSSSLLLGQASLPVSQLSVILLRLAAVALETEIHFPMRLEAIRTFNSILESLSRDQRRLIQTDQNQNQILAQVAAAVLTVGDYELQVSLSEALCRLTPRKEREQRASQWFSSRDMSSSFCDIRDGDFEVDCRRFLNFINSYHGDQRRVYTFPCLRAFLDLTQLFRPKDEKLDEFWIDFNLGSGCVSFFIDEPQGFLWGSIHLLREEVDQYSLQVKDDGCTRAEVVLSIRLNNPIIHHNSRGQTVELSFSCEHQKQLEEAAGKVFMRAQSSPHVKALGGAVQAPPSAVKQSGRSYSRKKPQVKSHLKILPLSSPSSEDDSSLPKTAGGSRAEFLFDQIRTSTPSYCSGAPVGPESQISQNSTEEFGETSSDLKQDVSELSRKRSAQDSGYLSDQNESMSAQKRRLESRPEAGEASAETNDTNSSVEPLGTITAAESSVEREQPVDEPGGESRSDLTSGITAAFKTFKDQLEEHFTGSWKKVESEVLVSLNECSQHVSSLLTAVHQHRSLMLQMFENSITDQLKQLDKNSTNLNSINSQILSFFQSEMKRLGSFCDEHLQRLKFLENEKLKNSSDH